MGDPKIDEYLNDVKDLKRLKSLVVKYLQEN